MKYRQKNWKYRLEEEFSYTFTAPAMKKFASGFIECTRACETHGGDCFPHQSGPFCVNDNGMAVQPGYAWDGPSGLTIDTRNSMRASLVHDVLYQTIREGGLRESIRRRADLEFRRILKEDGMWFPRRWAWWGAVRLLGGGHARP